MVKRRAVRKKTAKKVVRKKRTARKVRPRRPKKDGGDDLYGFRDAQVEGFSTGCTLLDNVLGGAGWALGRVANIVGDKSTGKTLLAIEACANFHQKWPEAPIHYIEVEAAFDPDYARNLGLPGRSITFPNQDSLEISTVEALFKYLETEVCAEGSPSPELVVLDSLDALSFEAEEDQDISKGTYDMGKQKKLSTLFRRLNPKLARANVCLIVISQVRDNIDGGFGEKHRRAGGKALDFYASQVLWLSHIGQLSRQRKGAKRVYGVKIKAKCKKLKVGPPFRDCTFPIVFGFGVDDLTAALEWIVEVRGQREINKTLEQTKKMAKAAMELKPADYRKWRERLVPKISKLWLEIEEAHRAGFTKYGSTED